MTEPKQKCTRDDFRNFYYRQAALSRPFIDLDSLLNQELIIWLVLFRSWVREAVWKLGELDEVVRNVEEAEQAKGTTYKMLVPGTPDELLMILVLRQKWAKPLDMRPITFIIWANTQTAGLINEIEKRVEKDPIAKKMIAMIFQRGEPPEKELLEAVQREARKWRRDGDVLKSYEHEGQGADDRRQEVLTACVAFKNELKRDAQFDSRREILCFSIASYSEPPTRPKSRISAHHSRICVQRSDHRMGGYSSLPTR